AGMRILVTNDDGVESPGILRLADELRRLGDVTVVAPDGDRSAISHRISFRDPVGVVALGERSVPTFSCTGTPADCVVLGAFELCDGFPDLLVSGINRGANLGDDVNYSGTVAAAMEATLIGIPALAVSLCGMWHDASDPTYWETASALAVDLAEQWRARIPEGLFINLNVPNVRPGELRGVRVTRQGQKRYSDRLIRLEDEGAVYRITGRFDMRLAGLGTDLEAVRDGFASVTPMKSDRTADSLLAELREELEKPARA
ncbi:MAG: 5'/3'-nucleotidase SurE, partial [Candidatus Eremiobacteraeota bacterium]|nr:5'/3'-nucleotidase SurE [Candidatus Eremiobacteraeota bacterium]